MSRLVEALQTEDVRTTNGMVANSTTLNECINLFFSIGAMRGKSVSDLISMFSKAFNEDPRTAMRILFWSRDVRGGAGERKIFRDILSYLVENHPDSVRVNLDLIPEYGRWDDISVLFNTSLEDDAVNLFIEGLGNKNGLCAKWIPRKGEIFNKIRRGMKVDPKTLRKTLVSLSNTVEQKMCSKNWGSIEYPKVPSLAISRYGKAFGRNDAERFKDFIESLKKGEVKVNAGAVYPYDILKNISMNHNKDLANEQWKALPNYMEGSDELILPMVDVSGSMMCPAGSNGNVMCLDVAISLGLYISERNEGSFKDMFMTFSSNPSIEKLRGNLSDKFLQLRRASWGMTTNLEAAFKLVLNQAVKFNVPQSEMPSKILILSDMQFNQCTRWDVSTIEMIDKMYAEAGYTRPGIIFWNLNARNSTFPVKFDQTGTCLVSGFSPSIMTSLLGGDDMTPISIMRKTVDSPRYEAVTA